jgi:hypothetical protein
MSLSKPLLGVFAAAFIWGGVLNWQDRKELAQPLNPSLSPGFICDQVAAKTESKPTVGWYQACIKYAAEVQRDAIATEARRAGTVKQGPVHEGAGRRHRPNSVKAG